MVGKTTFHLAFGLITSFLMITKLLVQMGHLSVELCNLSFLCAMNLRLGSRKPLEQQQSIVAISAPNRKFQILKRAPAHRREAVKEAIHAIWGENGPDLGVTEEIRNWKINNWLRANDRTVVGEATIRRALQEMRLSVLDRF